MTAPPCRRIPGIEFRMDRGSRSWTALAGGLSTTAILIGLSLGAMPARANERAAACAVAPAAEATVTSVTDERTLRFADGSEVRLAGLEAIIDAGDAAQAEALAHRAKAELERLTGGRTVAIQPFGEDRYGRRLALAVPAGDRSGPTLQERLISSGFGLAGVRNPASGCISRFLTAERGARAAHLGLWANRDYVEREAERPESVSVVQGRFALVKGRVVSVNDRGAIVYVNFGRRWSEDFTVTIAKRNAGNFVAAGFDPRTLTGRQVRVRGWIGERGGPWIEAVRPEQIEIIN
jgi:endonuclease YncB( thermonuclease family)